MLNKYMLYKNKIVNVKICGKEKFEKLQLDAKRILGLKPAKQSYLYLTPPKKGNNIEIYATHILSLKWPVVFIWIGYPFLINLNELDKIP